MVVWPHICDYVDEEKADFSKLQRIEGASLSLKRAIDSINRAQFERRFLCKEVPVF